MMMVRGPWSLCFQRTGLRPLAAWHTNCTLGIRVAFRLDMALLVNQFGSATLFDLIWLFDMLDMTCDFWLLIFYFLICFSTWYDCFANSVQSGFLLLILNYFWVENFKQKRCLRVYISSIFILIFVSAMYFCKYNAAHFKSCKAIWENGIILYEIWIQQRRVSLATKIIFWIIFW